jgi:Do/DeqQ family serine protease
MSGRKFAPLILSGEPQSQTWSILISFIYLSNEDGVVCTFGAKNAHFGWLAVLFCTLLADVALAQTPPAAAIPAFPSLAPMVARVTPAVVGISTAQAREQDNPLSNSPGMRGSDNAGGKARPGDPARTATDQAEVRPSGSGVVIDAKEGWVLTNHHVIQGASRVVVVLKDRRELEARVVGSDAGVDIALLKISAPNLTAITMGDSDKLLVGDFVVAIGNPFGIGQTVTSGIVSALSRGISPEGYEDYVQTDAAINPGNSGGALLNLAGELIGINTAILGSRGSGGAQAGNIGIGFAVPTRMALAVVEHLKKYGEVRRGRIGVKSTDLTPAIAQQRGLSITEGALVESVDANSPASQSGLRAGDVVTRLNTRPVRSMSDFRNQVALIAVGDSFDFQYVRVNVSQSARMVVAPISSATQTAASGSAGAANPGAGSNGSGGNSGSGANGNRPNPEPGPAVSGEGLFAGVAFTESKDGLVVGKVPSASAAFSAGLREGDIVLAIDRQAVTSMSQLRQRLQGVGDHVISILRGESKFRLTVRA